MKGKKRTRHGPCLQQSLRYIWRGRNRKQQEDEKGPRWCQESTNNRHWGKRGFWLALEGRGVGGGWAEGGGGGWGGGRQGRKGGVGRPGNRTSAFLWSQKSTSFRCPESYLSSHSRNAEGKDSLATRPPTRSMHRGNVYLGKLLPAGSPHNHCTKIHQQGPKPQV